MYFVIGPVGPDTCEGVPPKIAAKKPVIIAPYSPASAPAPEASPIARAKGNATMAAVIPPVISPLILFKFILSTSFTSDFL